MVQLEERIAKERRKLEEFREYPEVYDDAMREDIAKGIDDLNEDLKFRQESIDILNPTLPGGGGGGADPKAIFICYC